MNLHDRRKMLKDNLLNYGIDYNNPVDYELIDDGEELFIVVLELDSTEPPQGFHYSLIAKKYLIADAGDPFINAPAELVSIEYLGVVLKWWD